ncbi:MAG: hypothetical protein Q8O60_06290, partial [Deltaproteobacteria bacterium]|nr:hypothetical protein [Deltaproteobacteria bacterium]
MKEYTIYPLTVGANETDQGIMTYQRTTENASGSLFMSFILPAGEKIYWWIRGLEEFMAEERQLRRMEQYAARRS